MVGGSLSRIALASSYARAPLDRLMRTWRRGLAVAGVLLVLELGILGAAAAHGLGGRPASFVVPMPRVGDEVRYAYQVVPAPGADSTRRAMEVGNHSMSNNANFMPNAPQDFAPYQDLRIEAPRSLVMSDGSTHDAYVVHGLQFGMDLHGGGVTGGFDAIEEVDAATKAALRETTSRVTSTTQDGQSYTVNDTRTDELAPPGPASRAACASCGSDGGSAVANGGGGPDGFAHVLPCLAFNLVQGKSVATDGAVRIVAPCQLALYGFWDPSRGMDGGYGSVGVTGFDAPFTAVRTEHVGALDAVVFRATWAQSTEEIWLSPQVPYPLRLVADAHWGTQAPSLNYVLTIQLDRYTAGLLPLPDAGSASAFPTTAPPVAMGSRQPWGMDDAGIDAPFPASAAWRYLQDQETSLHGSPASGASFTESSNVSGGRNTTTRTWTFILTDGASVREARVWQIVQVARPAGIPSPLLGFLPGTTNTSYGHEMRQAGGAYALADTLPAGLPSVQAMWDAWSERGGQGTPNSWGFAFRLSAQGTRNGVPVPRTVVGEWDVGIERSVTDSGGRQTQHSVLRFLANGQVVEFQQESTSGPGPAAHGIQGLAAAAALVPWYAWRAPAAATVAGAGLMALLGGFAIAWLTKGAKGIGALWLFSRLRDDELLAHPVRAQLVQLVEARPGIHHGELARVLERSPGAVEHHVRRLVKAGILSRHASGHYTCYFVANAGRQAYASAPLLKSAVARSILDQLGGRPGQSMSDVARAAGVTPAAAHYHVERLSDAGLLVSDMQGTRRVLRLTPDGEAAARRS